MSAMATILAPADGRISAKGSRPVQLVRSGAWGTSFWIDPKERLVGILMAQGPSNRIHTGMIYKNLLYGSMVK